jgi:hypothetical protein
LTTFAKFSKSHRDDAPTMKSIAERVIEHARRGERDPAVLSERVISEMRASEA